MEHQNSATETRAVEPSSFVVRHEFDDVDELAEVGRTWDLDFRQLSRGAFAGDVYQAGTPSFQLARTRLRGVVHQHGTTPPGLLTFAVPAVGDIDLVWRGHTIGRDSVMVHRPSSELESVSGADFDIFLVSVSMDSLEQAFERLGTTGSRRHVAGLEITQVEPLVLDRLRRWVNLALTSVFDEPRLLDRTPIVGQMKSTAADRLAHCLWPGLENDRSPARIQRRRGVENAIRLARQQARSITSVVQLSRLSGVSERTLRRGFRERFRTSPKAYLQAQRLIGVRRRLRATRESISISDIANEWGFWHMGQFAADYRRHFGELPSETVRHGATKGT